MIIVTWNVNSIKVRLHAVLQYLSEESPDVLVLQETKSIDENFPVSTFTDIGYHAIFCGQKTYNGVAIISKLKAKDIQVNPISTPEKEMRSISAIYNGIRIVNLYVVNGQNVDTPKYDYKLRWLKKLITYTKKELAANKNLLLLGDFNIAPSDNDVFDEEITKNEILCSDAERLCLNKLLSLGLHDIFYDYDFPPKTFTWWDYRGGAFQRNIGYRIDLLLASDTVKERCSGYFIDKKTRHKSWCVAEPRTSDHVPVRILLD